jgi:hypothetical protein
MGSYRALTDNEKAILRRLLHPHVQHSEVLLRQIDTAQVEVLADDDSLVFQGAQPGSSGFSPVAEAEYKDKDGVTVHLTVFASDVSLLEIDIHKQDGSRITEPLDPKRLDVFWPPEPGKKGWWEQ